MDPALANPPALPTGTSAPWASGARRVERLCHATGLLLVLSGLAHLVVFAVAGGPWDGPVSWRKPVTFGLSFGVTLIAVTWVTSYLRVGTRTRAALLTVFAADCVVEVGGITLQAWRGVPSHLDMETPFDTAIARGVVLTRTGHQEAAYHSTAPLKPLHGVSLHAVLVLPALAWLLSRTPWSETLRRRILYAAIGCYVTACAGAGIWAVLTY